MKCSNCGNYYTVYLGNTPMCHPYKGVIDVYQCDKCGFAFTFYRYMNKMKP